MTLVEDKTCSDADPFEEKAKELYAQYERSYGQGRGPDWEHVDDGTRIYFQRQARSDGQPPAPRKSAEEWLADVLGVPTEKVLAYPKGFAARAHNAYINDGRWTTSRSPEQDARTFFLSSKAIEAPSLGRRTLDNIRELLGEPRRVRTFSTKIPREPTETMLDAAWQQTGESREMRPRTHASMKRYWQAMFDAAIGEQR